jgi:hypothetical protein
MTICNIATGIQVSVVIFAASAAWFWYKVSVVKVPSKIGFVAVMSDMIAIDDLEKIAIALQQQGRLNMRAAVCAAIAALLQGILVFMPNCADLIKLG